MHDPEIHAWMELAWRRKLTAAEQARLDAWVASHPEAQADWQEETALTGLIGQDGVIQPSSNFTRLVLEAVERETRPARPGVPWMRRWLPRFALTGITLGVITLTIHQHRVSNRAEMAESLATVSDQMAALRPEWLRDFDAINRLNQSDDTLLALLK